MHSTLNKKIIQSQKHEVRVSYNDKNTNNWNDVINDYLCGIIHTINVYFYLLHRPLNFTYTY